MKIRQNLQWLYFIVISVGGRLNCVDLAYTFVSHYAWINMCDFVYIGHEQNKCSVFNAASTKASFDPNKVFSGATVYVEDYCIESFMKNFHSRIQNPYIMVLRSWDHSLKAYLHDSKIIATLASSAPLTVIIKMYSKANWCSF